MLGKISRLPKRLRDQVDLRLANSQPAKTLLPWLNSLPEVQEILKTHFKGQPIRANNLTEYRKRGFRRSELRQSALEFAAEAHPDLQPPNQPVQAPAHPFVSQLVDWISVRFAAAAHTSDIPDDPEIELRQLRQFLADIVALRRGDLTARRIQIEEQRLALQQSHNEANLEKLFLEWTKRPDISSQPRSDPAPDCHEVAPDPAALI